MSKKKNILIRIYVPVIGVLIMFQNLLCLTALGESNNNITVDVQLKLFNVIVLDSDGKPIRNLYKDRFHLFIDGNPVPIGTFDEVNYLTRNELNSDKNANPDEKRKAVKEIPLESDSIQDKRLFIFIFHNLPWSKSVRQEIADGINGFMDSSINSNNFYSIYFFNGPAIVLLQPFTNNTSIIKEKIDDLFVNNKLHFNPFLPIIDRFIVFESKDLGEGTLSRSIGNRIVNERAGLSLTPKTIAAGPDAKTIYEMNLTMDNLNTLLRSFSSFKSRKEVFFFSESLSLIRYSPLNDKKGKKKSGIQYDQLIVESRTQNTTIHTFNLRRSSGFNLSGLHGDEFRQREDLDSTPSISLQNMGIIKNRRDDLRGLASDTGGIYCDKAFRKSTIISGMKEAYDKSSDIYYLGIYVNNKRYYDGEEHSVRIEVDVDDADIIYQPSFRIDPEYKKMDDGNRFSQFLDAYFGVKKYDSLSVSDTLLHFPYGPNNNLLVNIYRLPLFEETGDIFNLAIRYYNLLKNLDNQFIQTWDIKEARKDVHANICRFIVAVPLESGEYINRYVIRDEDNGTYKNTEYAIGVDSSKGLLSSVVVFGTAERAIINTNLLELKETKIENNDSFQSDNFKITPELNPFNYDGKILLPLSGEPIRRDKEVYVMYMYNDWRVKSADNSLTHSLVAADGKAINVAFQSAEPDKDFSGGWRRITHKLPLEQIPVDCKELKFIVTIKDKGGKEIESESTLIKLE